MLIELKHLCQNESSDITTITGITSGRFSLFSPEIVKSLSRQVMSESVGLKKAKRYRKRAGQFAERFTSARPNRFNDDSNLKKYVRYQREQAYFVIV